MTQTKPALGVDGFNLAMRNGTGVATYARNLAHCQKSMGHAVDLVFGLNVARAKNATLSEILFFERLGGAGPQKRVGRFQRLKKAVIGPGAKTAREITLHDAIVPQIRAAGLPPHDRLWNASDLFADAVRYFKCYGRFLTLKLPDPPAIMHWTYPLPVRLEGAHNIYTIHDLVPLRLPAATLDDKRFHYALIRHCLQTADQICTVSEASRADILAMFPAVDPARVTNTYQAVEPIAPGDESLSVNALFDLKPSGYFLYYGALEPKKNIGRLLEAFLASDVAAPLVLVGPKGWMAGGELRLLKTNLGLEALRSGRIRRLDYLPRAMLMQLVRGALAVVFPSIYEGFGLPALEAMMVGTPLLTSGSGALAEIVGKAALMVDPYDVGAIRTGLTSLERDADLRAQLAREGLSRAEEFSMAAYRERLSTLYAEVLARPRRPGPSLFSFPQGDEKP